MEEGVIIKSTGSWYDVRTADGRIFQSRIIGKLRLDELKTTNPVSVGDRVRLQIENPTEATIQEVLPRKNYVVRQSPRKKHSVHLIACNVDQALLITTIVEPKMKQGFIDRFLLMTEPYNIPVIIAFNKSDIYQEDDMEHYRHLKEVYENIGYTTVLCSAITGEGIELLRTLIANKITLISGQSGVGKSSLVNHIQPNLELPTTEISDYSGKGQHTTTFAEMYDLALGGSIIDTPGIKTLGFNYLEIQDVAHNFREFFILSKECKFADCTHRNEPKCAVKLAVENREISELRYANYLQIIEEIENQNYWEIHNDI